MPFQLTSKVKGVPSPPPPRTITLPVERVEMLARLAQYALGADTAERTAVLKTLRDELGQALAAQRRAS
jgi:hypothetical protein